MSPARSSAKARLAEKQFFVLISTFACFLCFGSGLSKSFEDLRFDIFSLCIITDKKVVEYAQHIRSSTY